MTRGSRGISSTFLKETNVSWSVIHTCRIIEAEFMLDLYFDV